MAKVRIQARSVDSEDSTNIQSQPEPHSHHHQRSKQIGALAILARVWKRDGFVGWYQVTIIHDDSKAFFLNFFFVGNASTNLESGPFTGFAFHVERAI
jgi:hypothetical protein